MKYDKTIWTDRIVQNPNLYTMTNGPGGVTLTPKPGTITQAGTPLSADNMNKLEQAAYDALYGSSKVANVQDTGADATGTASANAAFVSALASTLDTVFLPKGTYLIGANLTIPAGKRLQFDKGAKIRPGSGVTLTINGSISADPTDWIFDISAGGTIAGNPKTKEVYPQWFGAVGDGVADDTAAFKAAMTFCNYVLRFYIPPGTYLLKDTIDNKSGGGWKGSSADSTTLLFIPTTVQDKKPCIRISDEAYNGPEFSDFQVKGNVGYNSASLATWIDPALFAQRKYEMFAAGSAAIEVVNGGKPVFNRIATKDIKIGLYNNSNNGHISSYDCNWNGLIGYYVYRNSGDYFIQGGGIGGAFCCVMFGVLPWVGHNGGIEATTKRVHTGFSPYGIYQVIDDPIYYTAPVVGGISGSLSTTRFEQIGEAAISLLPKSISNFSIDGFGMSWSVAGSGEDFTLPTALLAANLKQQYAVSLGTVINSSFTILTGGTAYKSSAAGAKGSAYIDILDSECDLTGLGDSVTINEKNPSVKLSVSRDYKINYPITSGNLLRNPEKVGSWNTYNGATFAMTNAASLPNWQGSEAQQALGDNVIGIKVTPAAANAFVYIEMKNAPVTVNTNQSINLQYYVYSPTSRSIRSRLGTNNGDMYDFSFECVANTWRKVESVDEKAIGNNLFVLQIFELDPAQPTYLVGVMVSAGYPAPYSSTSYPNTTESLGMQGAIFRDKTLGTQKMLFVDNDSLKIGTWDDESGLSGATNVGGNGGGGGSTVTAKINYPITGGNLVANPEKLGSWQTYTSCTFAMINAASLPGWQGSEPQLSLGDNVIGVRITPNGVDNGFAYLNMDQYPTPVSMSRTLNMEFYIYSPTTRTIRSRLGTNNGDMYDGAVPVQANTWKKISATGTNAIGANLFAWQALDLDPAAATYIVGVMVTTGAPSPYSATTYPSTKESLGADSVILRDRATGAPFRVFINNGVLSSEAL